MKFEDVLKIYKEYEATFGPQAYKHISEVLRDAKDLHKKDFQGDDREQSWKGVKGSALENLIMYLIKDQIENMGLRIVNGKKFERTKPQNLSKELQQVKKNLAVDFGDKLGFHTPDVDLVIYEPESCNVIAVLSSKSTLRDRIPQTAYWKIKLKNYKLTEHIRVYFITPDEDGTLTVRNPPKKGRAIVEADTDGSYVLSTTAIEESKKVKDFDRFVKDLKTLLK